MNTQASDPPGALTPALPQDVAQALGLINSILSLNDDPTIQPGQLEGMSIMLSNAEKAWSQLRANHPLR
jgi:hypothetical protein